jgi:hypothetical protein
MQAVRILRLSLTGPSHAPWVVKGTESISNDSRPFRSFQPLRDNIPKI